MFEVKKLCCKRFHIEKFVIKSRNSVEKTKKNKTSWHFMHSFVAVLADSGLLFDTDRSH